MLIAETGREAKTDASSRTSEHPKGDKQFSGWYPIRLSFGLK